MPFAPNELLLVGLTAVIVAVTLITTMVHYDLGPAAYLKGWRAWLLTLALGSGIAAFLLKLLLIVVITIFFQQGSARQLIHTAQAAKGKGSENLSVKTSYRWFPTSQQWAQRHKIPEGPSYVWQALPEHAPIPIDNPMTPEKVALGKKLFFDKNLSRDRSLSCASCHDIQGKAGTDGLSTSRGIDGQYGHRNAPTVWNAAFQSVLFWDGRASSLEEQAKGPLLNPQEMGMPSMESVVARVNDSADYRLAFTRVFPGEQTVVFDNITAAIAAYERSLVTADTPYDRFVRGEMNALTQQQLRGMTLFNTLGCTNCHYGPNFSAASVFDPRMPRRIFPVNPSPYEQHYDLLADSGAASSDSPRGLWRVPSLRNVALTGPWLHNGKVTELKEVVRIMASAQLGRTGPYLLWSAPSNVVTILNRPAISDDEIDDLVAFLHALSSDSLMAKRG